MAEFERCSAERDFGETGQWCDRPKGHDGLHFDWLDGRWWSDAGQQPPVDARSPFASQSNI